ncbi:hypothetical protein AB1Y20_023685 [Prymnesium parvum]|uniref:Uncharacterized protein n=1 Tax=Prymnesium parvum TaxID=97485 RepID=A0AB34JE57_PRYPA
MVAHLKEVLAEEDRLRQRQELPSKVKARVSEQDLANECPAPQFKRKTFKCLGTPTAQSTELSNDRVDLSAAEVLAAAQQRRAELEATGEIDCVSDQQPHPTGQGGPPLDKKLIDGVQNGEPVYIWCEAEVAQVADGEKDKASARYCMQKDSTIIPPAGALQLNSACNAAMYLKLSFYIR